MKDSHNDSEAHLRDLIAKLAPADREAVRADLTKWHGLLWSLLLGTSEQDTEQARQRLLRLL